MPEISVIVPVYNVEKYLEPCLNSILMQDFQDFEVLLVEDGSTDGSLAICQRLEAEEEKIKLLRHPQNRGLSAARNTGMEAASGKYICFVDSDDLLLSNALSLLHEAAEESGADVAYAGQYYTPVFAEGSPAKVVELIPCVAEDYPQERCFFPEELAKRLEIWLNRRVLDTAWNKLYRRDFIEVNSLRFDEGILAMEDVWFSFRVLCLARSIVMLPDMFYLYRQNPDSIMHHKPSAEVLRENFHTFMEGCRILSKFMGEQEFFRQNVPIQYMVLECAMRCCMQRSMAVYEKIPPCDLFELVCQDFYPVFGDNTAFVAAICQMAISLRAGCVQLARDGGAPSGGLWDPVLMHLADKMNDRLGF